MTSASGTTDSARAPRSLGVLFLALTATVALYACSAASPTESMRLEPPPPTPVSSVAPADPAEAFPGFEYERVQLMSAAELPEGVPVPVPAGGQVDDSIGAFEGELLVVEYEARFFNTAFAFYSVWIDRAGLEAEELAAMGGDATGWLVTVDGQPVDIRLRRGDVTRLEIVWD